MERRDFLGGFMAASMVPSTPWVPARAAPCGPAARSTAPLLPDGPLHTKGAAILDQHGNPVRICGTVWAWDGTTQNGDSYGNVEDVNYKEMFRTLLANGINCIRLTTTDGAIRDNPKIGHVNGSLNPDFFGLRYCQALQTIVAHGAAVGMKFIIDSHLNENADNNQGQQANGLWYDLGGASNGTDGGPPVHKGTVTDADFLAIWQTRVNLFKRLGNVIGYDIRNEPVLATAHAKPGCTWASHEGGTVGSDRDLRDMYQRVGNAILAIDPDALIICELPIGPDGFDGRGVPDHPVVLNVPNRLVYSAHEYPAEIGGGNWGKDSGPQLIEQLNALWGFIVAQNLTPVWIGECGTGLRTEGARKWAETFVSYMNGNARGGITLPPLVAAAGGIGWAWHPCMRFTTNWKPNAGLLDISNPSTALDALQRRYWGQILFHEGARG
jgi:endoglucanase